LWFPLSALENAELKALDGATWRAMLMPAGLLQDEAFAQRRAEASRIVAHHWQAVAPLGVVSGKGADNRVSAGRERFFRQAT
jgi:hypothetical protein